MFSWFNDTFYVLFDCRSHSLVNDQISIAMETKEHLLSQRQQFKRFQTRLNDMSNRFPLISRWHSNEFSYETINRKIMQKNSHSFFSLIQKINIRKRRDSFILGLVMAICTFLLILYAFNWISDGNWIKQLFLHTSCMNDYYLKYLVCLLNLLQSFCEEMYFMTKRELVRMKMNDRINFLQYHQNQNKRFIIKFINRILGVFFYSSSAIYIK